jgi:prepilin-type processing-associated H-X9-DG protein
VLIDENPDSLNDAAFAVGPEYSGASACFVDGPTLLHNGGCGFGFADGHAEVHKWLYPSTFGPNFQTHYANNYEACYPTPNNLDVAWIEWRSSAPNAGGTCW